MSELSVFIVAASVIIVVYIVCNTIYKIADVKSHEIPVRTPEELKLALDYKMELDKRTRAESTFPFPMTFKSEYSTPSVIDSNKGKKEAQ